MIITTGRSLMSNRKYKQAVLQRRGSTAIQRPGLSRPIRVALDAGIVTPECTVFDYGCGRGSDLRLLRKGSYDATGWDPVHQPKARFRPAEVVNLGYVVNVIEDPFERAEALRSAWKLAGGVLVVAARMTHERRQLADGGTGFSDGTVTSRGTFQKFYTQSELRQWINETLPDGTPPAVPAAPGVFFVFRDSQRRQGFIASRYTRRRAVPKVRQSDQLFEQHRDLLEPLMSFVAERGRLPRGLEGDQFREVAEAFGSLKQAMSVVRRVTGPEQWDSHREARRAELLLFLALSRFNETSAEAAGASRSRRKIGRPRLSDLPEDLQHDMRDFFGTYRAACEKGDRVLFSAGNRDELEVAVATAPIGKKLPGALYVHIDALDQLPLLLRIYEGCARSYLGSVDGANVIKLNRIEPKVSYLAYPTFDREAHPALAWSMRVAMGWCDVKCRDFGESANPPILHRKETLLAPSDERYERFSILTRQEEKLCLLEEPATIGTRDGWERRLAEYKVEIRGHRVVKKSHAASRTQYDGR
ncbi:MAG: DNA phosphorothioation-associated putative methyltransferase [Phycisphaeraceae bacterium]|nr:DNA phosphorothioation-associated putative methyltransferase [Phycisphaeraceae bacterium]